jgi:hypothetical protein
VSAFIVKTEGRAGACVSAYAVRLGDRYADVRAMDERNGTHPTDLVQDRALWLSERSLP